MPIRMFKSRIHPTTNPTTLDYFQVFIVLFDRNETKRTIVVPHQSIYPQNLKYNLRGVPSSLPTVNRLMMSSQRPTEAAIVLAVSPSPPY